MSCSFSPFCFLFVFLSHVPLPRFVGWPIAEPAFFSAQSPLKSKRREKYGGSTPGSRNGHFHTFPPIQKRVQQARHMPCQPGRRRRRSRCSTSRWTVSMVFVVVHHRSLCTCPSSRNEAGRTNDSALLIGSARWTQYPVAKCSGRLLHLRQLCRRRKDTSGKAFEAVQPLAAEAVCSLARWKRRLWNVLHHVASSSEPAPGCCSRSRAIGPV